MAATVRWTKAIVVGASSGIGEAMARQLAEAGVEVAVLGRRTGELARVASHAPQKLRPYVHDVEKLDTIPELFTRIVRELGGIDLFVYAAGLMPTVAEGEYAFHKDRQQMMVNVVGAMAWMNLVAAEFQAARNGTLVGISSVAGERGRRGNPAYGTSKAALTTYLEALRNRVSRYGVNVVTVKPGYVDTAMTKGGKGLFWLISADEAARRSLALAERGTSASGFVPRRWWLLTFVLRLLPSFVMRRLNV